MSSFPSACTTLHVSPSSREHTCDPGGVILSQGACLTIDHGQILGPELGLMEMSEVEYTHLQHLIQVHMEAHAAPPDVPDGRSHPDSPVMPTQAIDLSTSTDEHYLVMPGEKTPASHGEVPGFVLARVRGQDSPTELRADCSTSSQMRSRSSARVCLEKRFNSLSADTPRPQDIQSAVLSNFLTMLQQSAEAQEATIHPQMHKWIKTDRANPFEVSSPHAVTNMCEQVIGHNPHMVEPYKHQGLIMPKSFSFNFRPERIVTTAHYTSGSNSTEEQHLVNIENDDVATPAAFKKHGSTHGSRHRRSASAGPGSAGESGSSTSRRPQSHMSLIQRRERHNSKERERRKRIRLYCDELNMLVPFCESDTDKVTTLQWTTAFLGYIKKTYGDTFKEEFQTAFADGKGHFLKSGPSSGPDPIHREMDEILSIPLAVEQ
ncbi:transcription factor-like 5 protein [Cyclopterus lumpus]|uniref:transcription factor-like 5 protein n=1 Tax=Cyclopterus lumpus TaxID=8103 RepID=UPI001486E8EF|nr:transcription factor-like 5 protein [Cyclopterus lumpus]